MLAVCCALPTLAWLSHLVLRTLGEGELVSSCGGPDLELVVGGASAGEDGRLRSIFPVADQKAEVGKLGRDGTSDRGRSGSRSDAIQHFGLWTLCWSGAHPRHFCCQFQVHLFPQLMMIQRLPRTVTRNIMLDFSRCNSADMDVDHVRDARPSYPESKRKEKVSVALRPFHA